MINIVLIFDFEVQTLNSRSDHIPDVKPNTSLVMMFCKNLLFLNNF